MRQDAVTARIAGAADRKFVTALARGLEVLRCFGTRDRWLTQQEIVKRTGLAKPTVARLVHTLTLLGHVSHSAALNKYALGSETLSLGFSALGQMDVRRIARPLLQALLGAHEGRGAPRGERQPVDVHHRHLPPLDLVHGRHRVSRPHRHDVPGSSLPERAPGGLRRRVLAHLREASGEEWPQLEKGIAQGLAEYEELGYCLCLGEWRRELHAIAVPLLLPSAVEPVVFSCSGAAFQLDAEVLRRDFAPRLLTVVGNVRSALSAAE